LRQAGTSCVRQLRDTALQLHQRGTGSIIAMLSTSNGASKGYKSGALINVAVCCTSARMTLETCTTAKSKEDSSAVEHRQKQLHGTSIPAAADTT